MASKVIGIDIGSNLLKIVVCSGGVVKDIVAERIPENFIKDGRIVTPAAMADFLKAVCKDKGIRPGPCAMVLPPQVVIAHKVTMPLMEEKELMLNLPYEFRDFVGGEAAKYDYDYSVAEIRDKVMVLYAAAVNREVVEEYYNVLHKAGLVLKAAMPAEMAWLNLICKAKNEPKKLCVVDSGSSITRVSIFSDESYEMGRDIPMGGKDVDKAIAAFQSVDVNTARIHKETDMDGISSADCCADVYADISVEIMRIVNFYRSSAANGMDLQDIYYCGGSSAIKSLRTAILKRTNLTMHHISRLVPADDSIDEDKLLLAGLAAGAAAQLS